MYYYSIQQQQPSVAPVVAILLLPLCEEFVLDTIEGIYLSWLELTSNTTHTDCCKYSFDTHHSITYTHIILIRVCVKITPERSYIGKKENSYMCCNVGIENPSSSWNSDDPNSSNPKYLNSINHARD